MTSCKYVSFSTGSGTNKAENVVLTHVLENGDQVCQEGGVGERVFRSHDLLESNLFVAIRLACPAILHNYVSLRFQGFCQIVVISHSPLFVLQVLA